MIAEMHPVRITVSEKGAGYLSDPPTLPHHCALLGDIYSKQTQTSAMRYISSSGINNNSLPTYSLKYRSPKS